MWLRRLIINAGASGWKPVEGLHRRVHEASWGECVIALPEDRGPLPLRPARETKAKDALDIKRIYKNGRAKMDAKERKRPVYLSRSIPRSIHTHLQMYICIEATRLDTNTRYEAYAPGLLPKGAESGDFLFPRSTSRTARQSDRYG